MAVSRFKVIEQVAQKMFITLSVKGPGKQLLDQGSCLSIIHILRLNKYLAD
jgi:hypothetical protein